MTTDAALQVVINAQLLSFGKSYRNAGVSRYIATLLEALSTVPAEAQQHYVAYVGPQEYTAATESKFYRSSLMDVQQGDWNTSRAASRIVWEQIVLPNRLRAGRCNVFHGPVNVLPNLVPCASVVTVHDLAFARYPQYFKPANRIYQSLMAKHSAHKADLVVAVSESTKQDLVRFFSVPEEKVRVVYPAIDDDYRPVDDVALVHNFRSSHGLPDRYLLYLGTLEPRKNLLTLVEAFAHLRARDDDVPQLVIAGAKGWYFDSLIERVRALGLSQHVTFTGYVSRDEQRLWYAGAELFIYPSVFEGFGLPVAEALACGTPVITSNLSSLPEAGGPVARQVNPTNALELSAAIAEMLDQAGIRAQAHVEGPRWTAKFSRANLAREYVSVYAEAAARWRSSRT